jgi:hypothetical protein
MRLIPTWTWTSLLDSEITIRKTIDQTAYGQGTMSEVPDTSVNLLASPEQEVQHMMSMSSSEVEDRVSID